jgi:hypothetical protein
MNPTSRTAAVEMNPTIVAKTTRFLLPDATTATRFDAIATMSTYGETAEAPSRLARHFLSVNQTKSPARCAIRFWDQSAKSFRATRVDSRARRYRSASTTRLRWIAPIGWAAV